MTDEMKAKREKLFSGGKKAASFFRLSRIIFSGLHTI